MCDHSLRALPGDVVACPECEDRCDLAGLLVGRGIGLGFKAPGYGELWAPAFVVVFATVLIGLFAVAPIVDVVCLVFLGVLWIMVLRRIHKRFGSLRGPALALLAHLILVGYLIGAGGMVGTIMFCTGWMETAMALLGACACGSLLYGCWRGDRHIAEHCIRRHLQKKCVKGDEP